MGIMYIPNKGEAIARSTALVLDMPIADFLLCAVQDFAAKMSSDSEFTLVLRYWHKTIKPDIRRAGWDGVLITKMEQLLNLYVHEHITGDLKRWSEGLLNVVTTATEPDK